MGHELSALVEACGELVDRVAITPAQEMHAAIAGRVFGAVGPLSAPVRLVHDRVAALSYGSVRLATLAAAGGAAATLRLAAGEREIRPLSRSARGRFLISAANGLMGDLLAERQSDLAIPMSLRRAGEDVGHDAGSLATEWPKPTSRVAIFLHGLGETEELWSRRADGRRRIDFGHGLRTELGITPLLVRYNSGRTVASNGKELARLLEAIVRGWPVPVSDLVLLGHSMGGLVIRSACEGSPSWLTLLRHVVTLGAPHTGAPIEKGIHLAAKALGLLPEARPLAAVLDARSAGIRDLRLGIDSTIPAAVAHTFIGATLSESPNHLLGWAMGDLLVRTDSAAGRHVHRGRTVSEESAVHLGGLSHFDLLDHPLVYLQIKEALARSMARG